LSDAIETKMDFKLLILLFLIAILLTIIMTVVLKNMGPWNNPMLFFMVLFMTTWTIFLWVEPIRIENTYYPYITAASLAILISILLAAAKTPTLGLGEMRTIKDRKPVDVIAKPTDKLPRVIPNTYFWILMIIETLLILSAYFTKMNIL